MDDEDDSDVSDDEYKPTRKSQPTTSDMKTVHVPTSKQKSRWRRNEPTGQSRGINVLPKGRLDDSEYYTHFNVSLNRVY